MMKTCDKTHAHAMGTRSCFSYTNKTDVPKNLKIKIHKTTALPTVCIGMLEYKLRVSDNRILMTILLHKDEDVVGEWRKLHNVYS